MPKTLGRFPLAVRVKELERMYRIAGREIAKEFAVVDIGDFRELQAIQTEEKIDGLVKMLNRAAIKWSKAAVPEAYEKGYAVSKTRLEILGAEKSREFKEKTHSQEAEFQTDESMNELIKANQSIKTNVAIYLYLARQAARGLAQFQAFDMRDEAVIDELLDEALRAGGTRGEAKRAVRAHFRAKFGEAQFIRINGRNYNLPKYADLVAKTRLRHVQSMAVKNSCQEYQNDLVEISSHNTVCDQCGIYEGNIYSVSGSHPKYPYLDAWPPFHPRCQHNAAPTSEVALKWRAKYV